MLASTLPASIARGIRNAWQAYEESGTRSILDYREQGVPGVRLLHDLLRRQTSPRPAVWILGRPMRAPADDTELRQLVELGDGIGVPSVTETPADTLDLAVQHCHRARKPFSLHVSEERRDPIERVLAYQPDLLVHLCAATPKDLRTLADVQVPVAMCPTSNAFFRLKSPVAALHRVGIPFYFGTDNAMLGGHDLIREAARAHKWAPKVPDQELLRALTTPPEKAIKRIQPVPHPTDGPQRVVVLPRRRARVLWSARPLVVAR